MLVLLVIFMVTAPMFTPGVIEVPSVSQATSIDTRPLEVTVDAQGKIQLIDNDRKTDVASVADLAVQIRPWRGRAPVAISADANLKYAKVVQIADKLHQAGVKRVALTVKQQKQG